MKTCSSSIKQVRSVDNLKCQSCGGRIIPIAESDDAGLCEWCGQLALIPPRTVRVIPVKQYSRVVGYYSPVEQWNKGKQEEFSQRRKAHL